MGFLDAVSGKGMTPMRSPGEVLKFALEQGYDGWVRVRLAGDDYWYKGRVGQYTADQFAVLAIGSMHDLPTASFANVAGLELVIDPENRPLPQTTDNRFW